MGIFDQLMGEFSGGGASAAGPHAGMAQALLGLLGQGQAGGVAGLLQAFEQGGLGQVAASWVGNGQNLPVTADQITNVLGSERIQELAQKVGIPPEEASQAIAAVLPGLIDRLTPGGQVPGQPAGQGVNPLVAEGLGALEKFL